MLYTRKEITGIILVIIFFIFAGYLSQQYLEQIKMFIGEDKTLGVFIYGLFAIIAIVIAPMSSLPLVPVAATLWGSFFTAIITLISWVIGSVLAFILARKYGKNLIARFVDIESVNRIERYIKPENLFLSVILLRMVTPVDILSYALGILTEIKFTPYLIATIIGMIPFVLFFAYSIKIPFYYQISVFILVPFILFLKFKKPKKHG